MKRTPQPTPIPRRKRRPRPTESAVVQPESPDPAVGPARAAQPAEELGPPMVQVPTAFDVFGRPVEWIEVPQEVADHYDARLWREL